MKRIYVKLSGTVRIFVILLALLTVLIPGTVSAASVSVSATGGTIETGETTTVTISLSSSSTIGAYRFYLNYDSSVIEYVPSSEDDNFCHGGNGTLIFVGDPYKSTDSCSIKFKGVSVGSSKLTISADAGEVLDSEYNDLDVSVSNGTITVNAPREASSDATLKSMQIGDGAISPKFASDITEYSISVNASTDALTIDAQPNSSYAKVSISGNDLAEGENTVKIKVTAENGDTKTYYIYVNKAKATPTPSPEPTPTPTNTPIPTPGVEVIVDSIKVDEEGNVTPTELTYTLADTITADIPDGFELTGVTINGVAIEALKLNDGNLTLIQLSDGELYVYDKESSKIYPYQIVETTARNYRISRAPEDKIPVGYTLTTIELDGNLYPAYRASSTDEFVLVYAEEGQWYKYDTIESTIQRFDESSIIINSSYLGNNSQISGNQMTGTHPTATAASATGETDGGRDIASIVKIVVTVIVFLLAILFMILYVRERNRNLGYILAEAEEYIGEEGEADCHEDYEAEYLDENEAEGFDDLEMYDLNEDDYADDEF